MTAQNNGLGCIGTIHDPAARALLGNHALDLYERAYAMQGEASLESTRRQAALHEAGHALLYCLTANGQWPPPYKVRIWRDKPRVWLGRTHASRNATPDPADRLNNEAIYAVRTVAGLMSEWTFDANDIRLGSSIDELVVFQQCAQYIAELAGLAAEEVIVRLMGSVRAALLANSDVVLMLADALERRRKVEGRHLSRLLAGARAFEYSDFNDSLADG